MYSVYAERGLHLCSVEGIKTFLHILQRCGKWLVVLVGELTRRDVTGCEVTLTVDYWGADHSAGDQQGVTVRSQECTQHQQLPRKTKFSRGDNRILIKVREPATDFII